MQHQIVTVATLGVLVILVGFGGYTLYKKHTEAERRIEALETQLAAFSDLFAGIERELGSFASESELRAIQETTETSLASLKEDLTPANLPLLIDAWEPYVYELACTFHQEDGTEDTSRGSAHVSSGNESIRFITSAHILEEEDQTLEDCELTHPKNDIEITITPSMMVIDDEVDLAYGFVPRIIPALPEGRLCSITPVLGDHVVVLGYPSIGSETTVTATEGIIAGFEEPFYITSAKVDRGNSGGIAVDVERDCLIGIPTLTLRGGAEALARLLPISEAPLP